MAKDIPIKFLPVADPAPQSDLDAIEQLPTLEASAYRAASLDDRALAGWVPPRGSADADLEGELELMVARSRDMARNNGLVSGADQTLKDNIIGAVLRLVAKPDYRLLGRDAEWARDWSRNVEAHFRSWAETTECDAGRKQTLLGLSLQMLGGAFNNGDGLALPIWKERAGSKWGTRLHVIESDRLATPYGMERRRDVSGGIHQDQHGEPLGYWLMKNHPGDRYGLGGFGMGPDAWQYVPAYTAWGRPRVIHLHDQARAGQSRAAPLIKAVMREISQAGRWVHTELQTAVTNSLIGGVLESDLDPDTIHAIFAAGVGSGDGGTAETKYNNLTGGYSSRLQAGSMVRVPIGTTYKPIDSSRNTAGMSAFMDTMMRWIAAGLNMPYELFLKDFSKSNYSSARAALLEAWRYFYGRRRWIIDGWLNTVYGLWLEEAINRGVIEAPGFYENRYAYQRCRWLFQGRGHIDPVKEPTGDNLRLSNGTATLEQICAEHGLDWEEVQEQRAIEMAKQRELGLPISGGAVSWETIAAASVRDDDEGDGDQDGSDQGGNQSDEETDQ